MSALSRLSILLPIALLLAFGFLQRLQPGDQPAPLYQDGLAERHLADFLDSQGLPDAKPVFYSRDRGIRGLQLSLDHCNGNLQISVFPQGDELVSLWERRAMQARYETRYLYRGELHADFPLFNFWLHTNKAALLNKLMPESPLKHRSVLALAAPTGCDIEDTVPWHRFQL